MKKRPRLSRLDGKPQTILLVEDVARTGEFYQECMRLDYKDGDGERYLEYDTGDGSSLLIVRQEGSIAPMVPAAGAGTPATLTFAITIEGYGAWKKWLTKQGVSIEGEARWIHGGRSLYVLDPDGRRLELKTPPVDSPPKPAPPPVKG